MGRAATPAANPQPDLLEPTMTETFAAFAVPANLCIRGRALMLPAVRDAVTAALPAGADIARVSWEAGALTVYVRGSRGRWPTVDGLERALGPARAAVARLAA